MYCSSTRRHRRHSRQSSRKHKCKAEHKKQGVMCALFLYALQKYSRRHFDASGCTFLCRIRYSDFISYFDFIESPPLNISPVMMESSCGVSFMPLENQYCSRLISPPTMKA